MPLTTPMFAYVCAWVMATAVAAFMVIRVGRRHPLLRSDYARFLTRPWKVVTFVVACTCITVMAPYTGDPTWDHVDAFFMAALTYLTAPWAVGVLLRRLRGVGAWADVYVAVCVWMFSASWSYDGYLLLRDGVYPVTWAVNIAASSVLYFAGGCLWNLSAPPGMWPAFAFRREGWPQPDDGTTFRRVAWIAAPFMLMVTALLVPFLVRG